MMIAEGQRRERTRFGHILIAVAFALLTPLASAQTTYGLVGVTYITTVGSGTYTVPEGVTRLEVECVGGGGGGGSTSQNGSARYRIAGAGGSGAYVRKTFESLAASYSYAVGAAGTGGASGGNNAGAAGGTTTFDVMSCGGGGGGTTSTSTQTIPSGAMMSTPGSGGVASGGDLNAGGQSGGDSFALDGSTFVNVVIGDGGPSYFGGHGSQTTPRFDSGSHYEVNGVSATGPGSGGSSSACASTVTMTTCTSGGGSGAPGLIIVREYGAAPAGEDGVDGDDGIDCWDLDADGVNDPAEDVNSDTFFNGADCTGPEGPEGPEGGVGPPGPAGGTVGNWTLRLQFEPAASYETAPVTVYAYASRLGTPTNATMSITISGVATTVWENDVLTVPMTYAGEPGLYVYDWTPGRLGTFNILVRGNDTVESFSWNEAVYVTEDGVESMGSLVELPGFTDEQVGALLLFFIMLLVAFFQRWLFVAIASVIGILDIVLIGGLFGFTFTVLLLVIGVMMQIFVDHRDAILEKRAKEEPGGE